MEALSLPLPENLEEEALNVAILQEAYENVDQFQMEARLKLFKALAYHAIQPGTPSLDAALTSLCKSAAYMLPDTPEYQLAQYAQHYRTIVDSASQMTKDLMQQQAESDLGVQYSEFTAHLHQGQLTEASWGLVRLRKMLAEAKQQQQMLQDRVMDAASAGSAAQSEAVGAAEAAASVAETLEHRCHRSDAQLKQILDEGCRAMVHVLPSPSCQDQANHSKQEANSSGSQGGAVLLCGVLALPVELLQGPITMDDSQGCVEVKATEIWGAASVRGELQSRLSTLSDALTCEVFVPLLKGGFRLHPGKETTGSVSELSSPTVPKHSGGWPQTDQEAVRALQHQGSSLPMQARNCRLVWVPASGHPSSVESVESVESSCLTLLKLLANTVFDLDEVLLKALGEALWPRLADAYVTYRVQPLMSASVRDGSAVEGMVEAAAGLEEWAESCGLLDEPYLVPAVEAAVGRVLGAAQAKHLAAARTLLLSDLPPQHAGELVLVGQPVPVDSSFYQRLLREECAAWELTDPPCGVDTDGPLLAKGQYKVGCGVVQLVELAGEVLREAAASGNKVAARALVGSVHKFALLARELPSALPPSVATFLKSVPLLGLVHHNSLVHLADALLILQASRARDLEALIDEPLGLAKEALLLRHTARAVLKEQVSHQVQHLHELLSGLQGLRWVGMSGTAQAGIAARRAISQVLLSLGRWGRTLVDTLMPEALIEVCSQCLAGICTTLVSDVMAKSDIGIDDCRELRDILEPLVADALPALLPNHPTNSKQQQVGSATGKAAGEQQCVPGVPSELLRRAVASGCRPLRKLHMLLNVLDSSMKDIVSLWEERDMQAVGFSAKEVEHLISALFEQSQHMKNAISRVRALAQQ